jgi:cell division protein FtsL
MKVPKKNISSFHDVRPPRGHKKAAQKFDDLAREYEAKAFLLPKTPKINKKIVKKPKKGRLKIILAFFFLFIAGVIFLSFRFVSAKQNILAMANQSIEQLKAAVADIKLFNPRAAQEKIQNVNQNLNRISSTLNQPGIRQAKDILGEFVPLIKSAGQAFDDAQQLTLLALDLNSRLTALTGQLPDFIFNHQGDKLIGSLDGLDQDLKQMNQAASDIVSNSSQFGNYLPFKSSSLI